MLLMSKTTTYGIRITLISIVTLFTISVNGYSQGKSLQKEGKRVSKQLKDEGWKVFGTGKTIKEALDAHYALLFQSKGTLMTIEGHGKAKNINQAVRKSQNQAMHQYASMRESKVEGVTEVQMQNTQGGEVTSTMDFNTHFKSSTEQTVKSFTPTVVFYRTSSEGWVEVRSFFLVDILK